jgi:hypothetical protein
VVSDESAILFDAASHDLGIGAAEQCPVAVADGIEAVAARDVN